MRLRGAASADRKWVSAYCLAYAGGSIAAFADVARAAPEWMEVIGIEMPGKGELADASWPADAATVEAEAEAAGAGDAKPPSSPRAGSAGMNLTTCALQTESTNCPRSYHGRSRRSADVKATAPSGTIDLEGAMMARLADRLASEAAGSSLVLIGWSMGGMLAAELALLLAARGCPPQMLHVAGRMAPGSFIAAGDDIDKYLLGSEEMKASDAWREWLHPMIMADLRADARAEERVAAAWSNSISRSSTGKPPLDCLIQVCAGSDDAAFPPDGISAWRPLTSGRFDYHVLPGGHDILQRCTIELLRHISRALLPSTPFYAVEWRNLDSNAKDAGAGSGALPVSASPPLTCHSLTGRGTGSGTGSCADGMVAPASAVGALPVPLVDAPVDAHMASLEVALTSPFGLLLYVQEDENLVAQEAQCWEFIELVQRLVARAAAGRIVLVCPASRTCAALVAGASKAVPLEIPELTAKLEIPETSTCAILLSSYAFA